MKNLLYIIPIAFIISCSPKNSVNPEGADEEKLVNNEGIVFRPEQIELAGIKTAKIEKRKMSETIECSGLLKAPPASIATVSPIIGGFIKSLNYFPGDVVQKGAVLASLQHPDIIIMQQQYIEAKSQAEYYSEEYKRQGELTVENAASIKKMQRAKADYLAYEAAYKSLKSQLQLLGINPESIKKGEFASEFKLTAPIKGSISQLNANAGKYVNPEDCIYEIIDDSELNIYLNVFEKNISNVRIGQKIVFWQLNNAKKTEANVKSIGAKIDGTSHTTIVFGEIENKNQFFKAGMFVNASIYINEREAYAVPTEAIVELNNTLNIFIKSGNSFKIHPVNKGVEQNNFSELTDLTSTMENADIVIKGAYYLMANMESGE